MLESVYQRCMVIELENMGLRVQSEVPMPIVFRGQKVRDDGFRIDLLVEDTLIVELKSKETEANVDKKQLLTYLRIKRKQLGLLIDKLQ